VSGRESTQAGFYRSWWCTAWSVAWSSALGAVLAAVAAVPAPAQRPEVPSAFGPPTAIPARPAQRKAARRSAPPPAATPERVVVGVLKPALADRTASLKLKPDADALDSRGLAHLTRPVRQRHRRLQPRAGARLQARGLALRARGGEAEDPRRRRRQGRHRRRQGNQARHRQGLRRLWREVS
jgi:hypothetical protein